MISIPDEIKQIIKDDSSLINWRVTFPDGDYSDITNEQIKSDSMTFTESICSGDSLTLGLMESPTFEFTAHNIPNIKNSKIQVFCEIYCDNTVAGAVYKADLDSYVYQIPIGLFTVSSSPKDTDMEFRKVSAYASVIDDSVALTADYMGALNIPWDKQDIPVRIHCNDFNKLVLYDPGTITTAAEPETITVNDIKATGEVTITGTIDRFRIHRDTSEDKTPYDWDQTLENDQLRKYFNYFKIEGNLQEYLSMAFSALNEIIESIVNIDSTLNREYFYNYFMELITPIKVIDLPQSYVKQTDNYTSGSFSGGKLFGAYNNNSIYDLRTRRILGIYSNNGCVFNTAMLRSEKLTNAQDVFYRASTLNEVIIPISVQLNVEVNYFGTHNFTIEWDLSSGIIVKTKSIVDEYSYSDDADLFRIDYPREIQNKVQRKVLTINASDVIVSHENKSRKEYLANIEEVQKIQIRDVMASYAELQGKLGRINRYGQFEMVNLSGSTGLTPSATLVPSTTLYPGGANAGTVFPINYISCWYDDIRPKQIGRITCTFLDAENDGNPADLVFDLVDNLTSDYKTYNISGNYILDNCILTRADVESMLATMGANLSDVKYTCCDIQMLARPEIECGDFIQFITPEGQALQTIIFRRSIHGTQLLKDNIEVNASEDAASSSRSGGSSSSLIDGGVVMSVNGETGNVILTMNDLENDRFTYQYTSSTKTLLINGLVEVIP